MERGEHPQDLIFSPQHPIEILSFSQGHMTKGNSNVSFVTPEVGEKRKKSDSSPEENPERIKTAPKKQKQVAKAMGSIEKKLDALIAAVDRVEERQSETNLKIDNISAELTRLKERTESLETSNKTSSNNIIWLRGETLRIDQSLNTVQQALLSHHFAVYGLPFDVDANEAMPIMIRLAKKLGTNITKDDLRFAVLRKGSAKKSSFILGAFYDERLKLDVMTRFKDTRPIAVEDVVLNLPANHNLRGKEIFIRNQLTPFNRQLRAELHRVNNGRVKFIWENNGRILIKKDAESQVIVISSMEQISQLFSLPK